MNVVDMYKLERQTEREERGKINTGGRLKRERNGGRVKYSWREREMPKRMRDNQKWRENRIKRMGK